jgi:transposase
MAITVQGVHPVAHWPLV